MTDIILQFLKEINIGQLISMAAMFWFFYNRLDDKMEKRFSKLEEKVEDVDRRLCDVDRRLCRIEGSLSTQGHCLFNQSNSEKKAQ